MSSVLANIRELFGPPDPRSEREIEDELDAEFAFHIEQLEAEFIEQGVPPEHAGELARARFGNQKNLKRRCKAIAMEERIMLQRFNTVLMVIVMLAVVGVSIQVFVTQRHNTLALLDITSQIATMRMEAEAGAQQVETSPERSDARVLVEGNVQRAGWYPIEVEDGATYLHQIVQRAGGVEPDSIILLRRGGQGAAAGYNAASLLTESQPRIVLRPNDEIHIRAQPASSGIGGGAGAGQSRVQVPAGTWHQVDEHGRSIEGGYALEVISTNDIRNLKHDPTGTLALEDHDAELHLEFSYDMGRRPLLRITINDEQVQQGRWQLTDDVLALNVLPVIDAMSKPLYFRRTDDMEP